MQAIKFVVRRSAGNYERGLVLDQVDTGQISLDLAGTAASGVAQDDLSKTQSQIDIRPGMQVQAELHTGRKTILNYLLKPLYKSREALRER